MGIRKDTFFEGRDDSDDTLVAYAPVDDDDIVARPAAPVREQAALAPMAVPANAHLSLEWHLIGTWGLHADLVWNDYSGAGVRVTDLDDGFQASHPAIVANYRSDLSRDFATGALTGALPVSSSDNHGTAVIGEIIGNGAQGTGSVGVAFGAQAFGMRMGFGDDGGQSQVVAGFQYALNAHADVMNNSWGYTSFFDDDFGAVSGQNFFATTLAAMKNYVDYGRDGHGGIMVFAAGNAREDGDNTNYHNMTNSPYTITVAAIDSNGIIADFSTPGSSILVSAGGVDVLTTDRTGSAGYVSGNYVYFSGTSAAAPLVSGTVALMLEANPNLGWRDVQEILAYSAQHNDATNAGWQYNGATNWNGGGLHYSMDYGFGAVDAYTAVRLAESWTQQHDSSNMTKITTATVNPHLAITAAPATSSIVVNQDIAIEHILVNLDISESKMSGLTVTLIGPDGTRSVLIDGPLYGTGVQSLQFQTSTVADWGEGSAGTWTLQVKDSISGSVGTLNSWSLTFLGSALSANDTYIYTNAFAAFSGADLAARATISETNGGVDTLNLAAVSTASTVNLGAGTATIAGHAVTFGAGSIENVYGGDGNDALTGSAANNIINGGRGNDTITVTAGNDTIDGGRGTDKVVYGDVITSFQITITNDNYQTITDTAGSLGVDILLNIETFVFSGVTYTLQQLKSYVSGVWVSSAPTLDNITLAFSSKAVISSAAAGTQTYTAADLGSSGSTPWVEVNRDSTGLVLNYLGNGAPKKINITSNTDDHITLTGAAPAALKATIAVGGNDATIDVEVNAVVTLTAGNGDNDIIGSTQGKNTIIAGAGDNDIAVGNNVNKITLGAGDNTVLAGSGKNTIVALGGDNSITTNGTDKITVGDGNNTINSGSGADKIVAGHGNNDITVGGVSSKITLGNGDNVVHLGNGTDKLTVGNGDNTIYAGNGIDTITLGSGHNTVYLGAGFTTVKEGMGADTFAFTNVGLTPDKINHFSRAEGDKLDLSDILSYSNPATEALADFVMITTKGSTSTISVDVDGAANGSHFVTLAVVKAGDLNVDDMINDGSLVVL